jgi:hypothetical protein
MSIKQFIRDERGGVTTIDWLIILGGLSASGLVVLEITTDTLSQQSQTVRGELQNNHFETAWVDNIPVGPSGQGLPDVSNVVPTAGDGDDNGNGNGNGNNGNGNGNGGSNGSGTGTGNGNNGNGIGNGGSGDDGNGDPNDNGNPNGNNGHGNDPDGNDDSNPGASNDPNDDTDADGTPGNGNANGNNGHGNDADGNDDSNPGASNDPNDHTDDDGTPGNSGGNGGGNGNQGNGNGNGNDDDDDDEDAPTGPVVAQSNVIGCPNPGSWIAEPVSRTGDQLEDSQIRIRDMEAGGAPTHLSNCSGVPGTGYFFANPTYTLDLRDVEDFDRFEVQLDSSCDTTLLVQDGSGTYHFDDDSGPSLNSRIRLYDMDDLEGRVNIWIGTYGGGTCDDVELRIRLRD